MATESEGRKWRKFRQVFEKLWSRQADPLPDREAREAACSFNPLEFENQLRQLARRSEFLVTGSVNVIALDRLRQHFGDRWRAVGDRVHMVVRGIIERLVAGQAVYTRYGELAYVIVFAGLKPEEAQLRCALIANEIARRLFGENNDGSVLEVRMAILRKGETPDFQALETEEILRRAFGDAVPIEVPDGASATSRPAGGEPAAFRSGPSVGGPEVAKPRGPAEPVLLPEGEPFRVVLPDNWRRQVWEKAAAGQPAADVSSPPEAVLPDLSKIERCDDWAASSPYAISSMQFVYRPIWHVRRAAISAHMCIPARVTSEGVLLLGEEAVPTGPSSDLHADIDREVLETVGRVLGTAGAQGSLVAPVHFVTMAKQEHRVAYLAACRRIGAAARERLFLEVVGVPDRGGLGRLREAVAFLRPFCHGVILRLPLTVKDLTDLQSIGLHAVGVEASRGNEKDVIRAMGRFTELADRLGLRTYIHGLPSRSLTSAAVAAGFHFIDGDIVISPESRPGAVMPFGISDIYGQSGAG